VQRWLKFAKYLPQFGWQPVVYTPSDPERPQVDGSLMADVPPEAELITRPIWEPYDTYRSLLGKKEKITAGFLSEDGPKNWKDNFAAWVRGNLFIPDARTFWVGPSVRYLREYLKEHPVDAIATTGPPHSMHLIGMRLKSETGLPWIADFRDPWTNIDFYHELRLTAFADRIHRSLEHKVLARADVVLTVGHTLSEELRQLGAKKVEVITNGYDDADVAPVRERRAGRFTLAHIGTFTPSRNCPEVWRALADLVRDDPDFTTDFRLLLVGSVDHSVRQSILEAGLGPYLELTGQVSHAEVLRLQRDADALLLPINNTPNAKGILTGKLFEYLATGNPILAIGPTDGDLARILKETHTGRTLPYGDHRSVYHTLQQWQSSRYRPEPVGIDAFSRKGLTKRLVEVLNKEVTVGDR
jgi:glycosyltransferase involved in cell wall biosynthesis